MDLTGMVYQLEELYDMRPDPTPDRPATLIPFEVVQVGARNPRSGGASGGLRSGWTSRGADRDAGPRGGGRDYDRDRPSGSSTSDSRADRSSWLSKPREAAPAPASGADMSSSWRTARPSSNNNSSSNLRGGRESFGSSVRPGGREHKTVSLAERNAKLFARHLKTSDNAWKGGSKQSEEELDEVEVVLRKVKAILNKLTLDNFERLYTRLLEIKMTSHAMLTAVVNTVFDEALNEPLFGPIFAELCVHLSNNSKQWSFIRAVQNSDGTWGFTVSSSDDGEVIGQYDKEEDAMAAGSKAADFKRILLNKCQKEFETKHECVRAGCASAILVVCLAHVWVRVCCSCLVVLRRQDG